MQLPDTSNTPEVSMKHRAMPGQEEALQDCHCCAWEAAAIIKNTKRKSFFMVFALVALKFV
jgi:hypothetical protein